MDWDFFRTLGIVGFLGLFVQLSVFVWENWFNTTWRDLDLMLPVTLRQIFTEWATYMLLFIVVSMLLRGMLPLTCSIC